MDKIKQLLAEEIENQISSAESLEDGSDAKSREVEGVTQLCRALNDIHDSEERLKFEAKEAKKKRWIEIGGLILSGIGTAGTIALTVIKIFDRRNAVDKVLHFEEEGSITSYASKNELNRSLSDRD